MEAIAVILFLIFSYWVGVLGRKRRIGFGLAFLLSLFLSPIIGLIVVLFSKKKIEFNESHKFFVYRELAKKAEFKGQTDQAIDNYMDSLYHLENDYQNIDKHLEESRQKYIKEIAEKLEALKKIKSEQDTAKQ
jgi:uncharacterized membrane-anchored protein YhcB (DUF1043 family)